MTRAPLIAILLVGVLAPVAAAEPAVERSAEMSLADAVRYAVEHSARIAAGRTLASVASLQEDNARSKLFPSLDLSATHGFEKSVPSPAIEPAGAPVVSQLSLTLSQPIYDNGETWTRRDIASLTRELAELTARKTRDDVVLEVAKSFYRLSLHDILLGIKRHQLELLDKQFRLMQTQYRQGLRTKKDFLRLKSEVQRAAIAVQDADAVRRDAEIVLRSAIGQEVASGPLAIRVLTAEEAARADPVFPGAAPDLAGAYQRRLYKIEAAVAEKNIELVRRKNSPEVTLGSGVSYANSGYLGGDAPFYATDSLSWNVLLGVKYNLWDAGSRRRDVDVAEGQRLAQDLQAKVQLATLDAEVASLMTSLQGLQSSHKLNRELMQLESESYKHLEEEYRQGRVAYLDLITALADLLKSRVSYYSTYVSILEGLAQFRYHEGTLYEALTAP